MKTAWYFTLVAAICFEGLGRKYLPQIPGFFFYFFKDAVLLFGYIRFRPTRFVSEVNRWLYRGFTIFWIVGFVWTVIEVFNPEHTSALLGVIGMRAYWVWWAAPLIIANVLDNDKEKRRAIYTLLASAAAIAIFAAVQFAVPSTSALNIYSVVDGEEIASTVVAATGRSRVASTFSYVSGFSNFTILIPVLILSFGLDAKDPKLRKLALVVTCMTAAVVPMSGARASVLLGAAMLIIAAWSTGLLFTRIGRRIVMGGVAAGVLAVVVFPEAFVGVQSRFSNEEETQSRYWATAVVAFPPLALAEFQYPAFGYGTGTQQNARQMLHLPTKIEVEPEVGRYLAELGPFGFLVIWATKLGLLVALIRAYRILKRAGRRGAAAAALSYACVALIGNLAFDHIWQSLYFLGCGSILAEVVAVLRERAAAAAAAPPDAERALAAA
ncbi:MAG TPA: hypothetical protein VN903_39850 [Polyangia bacterium]|jgi:hypothetical protein|nr:hypothetical protein [Polyangia bacterium]